MVEFQPGEIVRMGSEQHRRLEQPRMDVHGAAPSIAAVPGFQERVRSWLIACFGEAVSSNRIERTHRFLEEAIELAQAGGCTKHDALLLVEYVFGRPQGKLDQEVGGVMVTLAGVCSAHSLNMDASADRELARIWQRIGDIRAKQAAKRHSTSLP